MWSGRFFYARTGIGKFLRGDAPRSARFSRPAAERRPYKASLRDYHWRRGKKERKREKKFFCWMYQNMQLLQPADPPLLGGKYHPAHASSPPLFHRLEKPLHLVGEKIFLLDVPKYATFTARPGWVRRDVVTKMYPCCWPLLSSPPAFPPLGQRRRTAASPCPAPPPYSRSRCPKPL